MNFQMMKECISPIAKRRKLELVVLFGSVARGKTNKFSDIDIAIRARQKISYTAQVEIEYEICKVLGRGDVEVVNLKDASPLLLSFIAKEGVALYEAEAGVFDKFQIYAMRAYFEAQPLIKLGKDQFHKHLLNYAYSQ